MLFLFICLSFSLDEEITVCFSSCPDSVYGTSIIVTLTDGSYEVSKKIEPFLSGTKTNIYFYNQTAFTFSINLNIFQGHTVEFLKYDESDYINVELECTETYQSTGTFIFRNIYVDFSSIISIPNIELSGLIIEKTKIDLFGVRKKLIVSSLTADKSINVFTSVDIKSTTSSPSDVTFNINNSSSLSITATDNGASVTLDEKTISFSFDEDIETKAFNVVNTDASQSNCQIEYSCTENSKLIQFSLTDLNALYFSNSWPDSAVVNVINNNIESSIICANSTVLPISLSGSIQSQIIVTQDSTTITGDVSSPVTFSITDSTRKSITIQGSFTGASVDTGSSYVDVVIKNWAVDVSGFGNFPFTIRVGRGGSSTVIVEQTSATTTKKTGINVYTDFESYLSDDELQNLLTNEWNIFTLTGVTFSYNFVNVMYQDKPVIHGFAKGNSCLTVTIQGSSMVLTASPPSLIPMNICFDGDKEGGECKSSDGTEIDDISGISDKFLYGMKYLNLAVKSFQLNLLDLTSIDYGYEGIEIILKGGSNTVIDSIVTKEGSSISYLELTNIVLGSSTFWVKKIQFKSVKTDGHPTFTFNNCEHITADDDFISNIAPGISSTAKIQTISYRMDKFDAMTVTDTKFIFYDVAMNDFSEPAELFIDVVNFLDLIYDIGIGPTAEENDLNVTMQTKNPPSFNITFSNLFATGIWSTPELILYSWSQTEGSDFKVYFMYDKVDTKIVLKQPYKPSQLIPIGTASLTYEDRYSTLISICTTLESDKEVCPNGTVYLTYDQLNDKLPRYDEENVIIYIKSQVDNCPSIDLFSLNKKVTSFIGISSESSPTDYVEITSSKSVNLSLTTTIFRDINVKTSSETTNIVFGELKIENAEFDSSLKEVEVSIDDFYCEYRYLSCFKKITITDNLFVSGDLSEEESTVEFEPDENSNDMNATISSPEVTLTMGDKYIKIGQTKFQFKSITNVYDIILYFEQTVRNVIFNKEDGVAESKIPNVRIRKVSEAAFTFSNNWKVDSEREQQHIFLFTDIDHTKIYLTGPNTPVSISADNELSLISKAENVGINGFFDFYSSSTVLNVLYEGVTKSKISVSQNINIFSNINFKFNQPNIELEINNVSSNTPDASTIQAELFSSLEGDSLLVIKNQKSDVLISRDYKVEVPISEDISNEKVQNYYSKNHTLIKVSTGNTGASAARTLTLIGQKPTTHGFVENNMDIIVNDLTGEISLSFKQSPLHIPFEICYETTDSCEITLSEENIDGLADLLPSSPITIQARFGKENSKALNLNIPKLKGSTVFIFQQSQDQIPVQITLGNEIISLLSLDKVLCKIADSTTYKVDRVELLNGAEIDKTDGLGTINVDFDSGWKEHPLKPTTNDIILNLTANSLTFTNKGFLVDSDSEILTESYPNMKFQIDDRIKTTLEASEETSEIKETTIYSHTKNIILGSNWEKLDSSTKINIVFDDDDLNDLSVMTSSYPFLPFPQLMSAPSIQMDPNVLPYKVPNDVIFDNITSQLDFSNVQNTPEKAHINFDSITFKGTASLSAKGDLFRSNDETKPITIQKLTVVDGSSISLNNVVINKSLVINGDSKLTGIFDYSNDLDVEMKWKLNKMPRIMSDFISNKVPQSIVLTFDEASIDGKEKQYDEFVFNKSFELIKINKQIRCENWIPIVSFNSPNVPPFGSKSVFDISCDDENLLLFGARHVTDSDSEDGEGGGNKLGTGAIIGIVIACVVVVAAIIGVVVFLKLRNKQNSHAEMMETTEHNEDNYTK